MPTELARAVARYIDSCCGPDAVSPTPVQDVNLMCSTSVRLPFNKVYKPSLCVVAQGAKRITLSDAVIDYRADTSLAVCVELPGQGTVTEASTAEPFLGMTITFDAAMLRDVMEQLPSPPRPSTNRPGTFVEQLSEPLLDCLLRLVRLFDTPDAVSVLYPSLSRELYYWLLTGPNGHEYSKTVSAHSHTQRIADAIFLMRKNVARPLRVDEMAETARMSVSSFHQHFRTLTSMSPLQYHKKIRLLEARRLMVAEATNVTNAALQVGYESPSQFSREYTRMFGAAPKRDALALKDLSVAL